MYNKILVLFLMAVTMSSAGTLQADMVILKSGEIFQTAKAWKENGIVRYYRNGRVVSVEENKVERLIHSSPPGDGVAPRDDRSIDGHPAPSTNSQDVQPRPQAGPSDAEVGYLDLKWGQAAATMDGLVHVATDPAYGGVEQYSRQLRHPHFGRASVDHIFYGFWHGKLYTVLVEVSNFLDFTDLKAEAFRRYGKGTRVGVDPEQYRWSDASSDRLLSYDDNAHAGYLWMRSRVLHAQVRIQYPD